MNYDQCKEFERIRDYGLMVVYSNWSFLKNRMANNEVYRNRELGWVAYVAGKRESRRLLGDHVLTENDLINETPYPDASFTSSWSIDLHYPDPQNSKHFPGQEFKSICVHGKTNPYAVPYRCLYSRNVSNLFMAETFIIGLLAGLFGIAITYGVSAIASAIVYNLTGIPNIALLPVGNAIFLIALSVGLTLISGLMPASSAAKKDPVVALRTE